MKLLKKLRKRIQGIRQFRLRKSRRIGILVERKNSVSRDEPNSKQQMRQQTASLSNLKLQPMLKTHCDNYANNIICLWKCDRNKNRVRILSVNVRQRRRSCGTKRARLPSRTKSRNTTSNSRSELEIIKEVPNEESNLNHSAKDFDSDSPPLELIPRSRSDEKYNKLDVETSILEIQKPERFLKYIPVDKNYLLIRKKIRNDKIGSSWVEIQAWCTRYQNKQNKLDRIQPTIRKSLTRLVTKDSKPKFTIYGESLEFGHCQDLRNEASVDDDDIMDHPRFGFHPNQEYLIAILQDSPELKYNRIQFSIAPEVLSASIRLCHLKTEMILSCLRIYFKDFADIEVMWVDSLHKQLPSKPYKSYFPLNIAEVLESQTTQVRAVLYVTEEVSVLLRHPDTCFLSTLAFTAGIKRDEMIILPFDIKPRYFSVVKR